MKYYLFLWITGCFGIDCPIEKFEEQEFSSQLDCEAALSVSIRVAKMVKKPRAGICLPEDMHKRIKEEWNDD